MHDDEQEQAARAIRKRTQKGKGKGGKGEKGGIPSDSSPAMESPVKGARKGGRGGGRGNSTADGHANDVRAEGVGVRTQMGKGKDGKEGGKYAGGRGNTGGRGGLKHSPDMDFHAGGWGAPPGSASMRNHAAGLEGANGLPGYYASESTWQARQPHVVPGDDWHAQQEWMRHAQMGSAGMVPMMRRPLPPHPQMQWADPYRPGYPEAYRQPHDDPRLGGHPHFSHEMHLASMGVRMSRPVHPSGDMYAQHMPRPLQYQGSHAYAPTQGPPAYAPPAGYPGHSSDYADGGRFGGGKGKGHSGKGGRMEH